MTNREKNVAKMGKMQQKLVSGMISKNFPEVSSIAISVTNPYGEIDLITILHTFNFWPSSYAYFNIECLSKDSVDGGFDLNHVITTMVRGHKDSGKGGLVCGGSNLHTDHSHIYYKVTIQYDKQS